MLNELKICVLVPVFNEEEVINQTLGALFAAGFSPQNIYVVDDKSTDNTANLVKTNNVNLFTVSTNGGKAKAQVAALNHFKLCAIYDWVIFLDGDTKVTKNFKTEMEQAALENPNTSLFVGAVESDRNDHLYSASRAYDYTFGQDVVKQGQDNFKVIFVSPGCSSMYSSKVLATLEIDHNTLAEDMDLTVQVHRAKGKIKFIPKAMVITQDPSTFLDYHKQILRWYRGFWQVVLKHKTFGFTKKQRIDYYMMYLCLDSLIFNRVFAIGAALSVFSLKATLIGALVDFGIFSAIGLYVACKTKRLDVLYKSPVFYWLSYLNLYGFIRSFVEIIVLRKQLLNWNKVKRYGFDEKFV